MRNAEEINWTSCKRGADERRQKETGDNLLLMLAGATSGRGPKTAEAKPERIMIVVVVVLDSTRLELLACKLSSRNPERETTRKKLLGAADRNTTYAAAAAAPFVRQTTTNLFFTLASLFALPQVTARTHAH